MEERPFGSGELSEGDPLEGLNDSQKQAVLKTKSNLLVVAGAGSGKTRVITEKIRHYVNDCEVKPYNILAITFTNKAAGEMRHRLIKREIEGVWVSTFHSLCTRVLRKEAEHLGLSEQFSIYDAEDQRSLVRSVLKDLQLDPSEWDPRQVITSLSNFKNANMDVESVENSAVHYRDRYLAKVYSMYEKALTTNQALDFDDLMLKTLKLFESHEMVLKKYQKRFHYVLVDEYQDTNPIQYRLTKLVSGQSHGVTVTGDPDQSIYSWRGADINNILNFEKDFKDPEVIKLEENYRSTKAILALSNQVIQHNMQRYPKELFTQNEEGKCPILHYMIDGREEARCIATAIAKLRSDGQGLDEIAVFYRTNAQSRALEEGMNSYNIPYIIVGGVNFFERMEVKDLIAYLRFIHNPMDSVSLMRIVNKPARGISEATKEKIREYADDNGLSCWQALLAEGFLENLSPRARECVTRFNKMMAEFFELSYSSPDILLDKVMEQTHFIEAYRERKRGEEEERLENIREFVSFVSEFCASHPGANLSDILEHVALMTDKKEGAEEGEQTVTLMTLHAAKGLEFPTVFFAGLDEGILPHQRSLDAGTQTAIEEERRLCYVGITRAQQEIHLYTASERFQFNRTRRFRESRFISEMMGDYLAHDRGGKIEMPEQPRVKREKSQNFTPMDGQRFRKGEPVKHPKYGKGIVLKVEESGASEKAKVFFDKFGEKTLLVEFEAIESLN